MASRRDIRVEFYDQLETAVDGLVDPTNIGQDEPEGRERHPSIVHNDDYRKIPINEGSGGPTDIERDEFGNVEEVIFEKLWEVSFGVAILDHDELRRSDVYAAVHDYFEKFEHPAWDASSIHDDVETVRVVDATSEDDPDASPTVRGDRLIIRVQYTHDQRLVAGEDFQNISEVTHLMDGNGDGVTDETYTTAG